MRALAAIACALCASVSFIASGLQSSIFLAALLILAGIASASAAFYQASHR